MSPEDKSLLANALNTLMEVYGKARLTPAVFQVWWDVLKEFQREAVFTAISYWPQTHSKPPVPAELWNLLNERRTQALEAKAKAERLENTGQAKPKDYAPTKEGKAFFRFVRAWMRQRGKPIHEAVLDFHENSEELPQSVVIWARERIEELA